MIEIVSIKAETEKKEKKEINLLPCPFCGKKAFLDAFYNDELKRMRWHIGCSDVSCGVMPSGRYMDTMEEAIEAWNARGGKA